MCIQGSIGTLGSGAENEGRGLTEARQRCSIDRAALGRVGG